MSSPAVRSVATLGLLGALSAVASTAALAQISAPLVVAADSFLAQGRSATPSGRWGDLTDEARILTARRQDDLAAALAAINRSSLSSPADRLVYGNLFEVNDARRGVRICRSHLWATFSPFSGWHNSAGSLARSIRVASERDRQDAVDLFAALPAAIRAQRGLLARGLDSGYTTARPVMLVVIKQLNDLLPDDMTRSPLYSPAERDTSVEFRAQWRALLADSVYPAAKAFRDYLQNEYAPRARAEGSMALQKDGRACYEADLRVRTSVRADVDSLMKDARREYDRIATRLAPLVRELTGESDLGKGVIALRSDPRFTFPSRDSTLAAYRAMTTLAESRIGRVVAGVAPESLAVIPYDAFQENAGLPPSYQRALGSARAARFMVNLGRTERMMVANAVAHEAYPGHHLQRVAEIASPPAHEVMRGLSVSGFVEGWGIYSEYLGDEMGLYTSALDRAGYLVHLLDVAVGMYLDAGFHTKGWSRQMIIDSMVVIGGRPPAMAAAYADRHAATPGQLATYYVGYRAIQAAREFAERELGSRFQSPEFHAMVLRDGPITLASLREKVDRWVHERASVLATTARQPVDTAVGFRTVKISGERLPMSVWYPRAASRGGSAMTTSDYLASDLAGAGEAEPLRRAFLDGVARSYGGAKGIPSGPRVPDIPDSVTRATMELRWSAVRGASQRSGTFPLVVFTMPLGGTGATNVFLLAERFAAAGYIVVSGPPLGRLSPSTTFDEYLDLLTQATARVVSAGLRLPGVDKKRVIAIDPAGSIALFLQQKQHPFSRIVAFDERPFVERHRSAIEKGADKLRAAVLYVPVAQPAPNPTTVDKLVKADVTVLDIAGASHGFIEPWGALFHRQMATGGDRLYEIAVRAMIEFAAKR